jgi:hypothetical protein
MKLFKNKKQKKLEVDLIEILAVCRKVLDLVNPLRDELENDRICGHWVNDFFSVSVFKMNLGYMVSVFRHEILEAQLTVILYSDGLRINDPDTGIKRMVSYNSETRELTVGDYGSFYRDYEKKDNKKPNLYPDSFEIFMNDGEQELLIGEEPESDIISCEEYRDTFLCTPHNPVVKHIHISNSTQLKVKDILKRMGVLLSVSGFVENVVANHLNTLEIDTPQWLKDKNQVTPL